MALELLKDIADQHEGVSYADLFQLASATAIEVPVAAARVLVSRSLPPWFAATTRFSVPVMTRDPHPHAVGGRSAHPAALRPQGHDGGQGVRAGGAAPRYKL